jgi:hypothetical protein
MSLLTLGEDMVMVVDDRPRTGVSGDDMRW